MPDRPKNLTEEQATSVAAKWALAFTAGSSDTGLEPEAALGLTAIAPFGVHTLLVVLTHVGALVTLIDVCGGDTTHNDVTQRQECQKHF